MRCLVWNSNIVSIRLLSFVWLPLLASWNLKSYVRTIYQRSLMGIADVIYFRAMHVQQCTKVETA